MPEELKKYIEEYCKSLVGVKLLLPETNSKLYNPVYVKFNPEEKLRVEQKVKEFLIETIQLGVDPTCIGLPTLSNLYCVVIKAYDSRAYGDTNFIKSIPPFNFES